MQSSLPAPQASRAATELYAKFATQPACFLSAHAYVCEFDDGAIILDLCSDTYLGIDALHLRNLRARIENWPESGRSDQAADCPSISGSDSLIADLLARGILTASPTSRQLSTVITPTTALTVASAEGASRRIPRKHVAQFSIALLMVVVCLRRARLLSLLEWIRRHQLSIHRGNTATLRKTAERLASFLWLRTWFYTAQRRCLFDSLVLSVYLTREMVPCTLVIGVATKPFLAHAWVQIKESVLNDTAEHVQTFKPIFGAGGE